MKKHLTRWGGGLVLVSALSSLSGCCDLVPSWCDQPTEATPQQNARIRELLGNIPEKAADQGAPAGQPCPASFFADHAGAIDSACARVVPGSGALWFKAPDGQPCWCACEAMLDLGPELRDSLVAARRASDIRRYDARADSLPPHMLRGPMKSARLIGPSGDSLRTMQRRSVRRAMSQEPDMSCDRTDRKVPLNGGCVSVSAIITALREEFPMFKITWDEEGADEYYPAASNYSEAQTWEPGDPPLVSRKRASINIPSGFIEHEAVGGELIAFLLAHEIGHALAEGFACNDSEEPTYCEGECDFWGIDTGLRTVYDGPNYIALCQAAAEQLVAYELDLWGDEANCGYPFCGCDAFECGYPPTECRGRIIRGACTPSGLRRVRCIENWTETEPSSCPDHCP